MTTTSHNVEAAPKLAPVLDGRKVVFSRENAEEPKESKASEQTEQPKESKSKSSDK